MELRWHRPFPPAADDATVGAAERHGWPDLDDDRRAELAPDDPAPMVDHLARREAAIGAFGRARGDRGPVVATLGVGWCYHGNTND